MVLFRNKYLVKRWEHLGKIDKLILMLNSERYNDRITAIEALMRIRDSKASNSLIPLLDDKVPIVREACAKALLQINPSDDIKRLIKEKKSYWDHKAANRAEERGFKYDEEDYSWKGRFKPSMKWTNIIRKQLLKPLR